MTNRTVERFIRDGFTITGSALPHVMPRVLFFGLMAMAICAIVWLVEWWFEYKLAIATQPFQYIGLVLSVLLVLRTNAGYERWWEARKLWGGIVNQSRNFVICSLSYGPNNQDWRKQIVQWASVYPHACRCSLRGEKPGVEATAILGEEEAGRISRAQHMPSYVAMKMSKLLNTAMEEHGIEEMAFLQAEQQRALLIDHIGACERILKTPLPRGYQIMIRRFLTLFLLSLPFALFSNIDNEWWVPPIIMLIAYPLLSLDQISEEIQNPFTKDHLDHLPLDQISMSIEMTLSAIAWEQ